MAVRVQTLHHFTLSFTSVIGLLISYIFLLCHVHGNIGVPFTPKVCISVLEMLTTIFAVVYKGYSSLVVNL